MLIEHFKVEPNQNTIDLGCGYGPIGMAIAQQCPHGHVHLVDKDFVAVEYATRNAERNGLTHCQAYLSNALHHVPTDFVPDNIVSNLPAKVGKELLNIILQQSFERLPVGGRLCVVTISGLRDWAKRNFREVFGNYKKLKQGKTYAVSMAVKE